MSKKRSLDPDYLFNIFKLNKWFAISSILLFLGVLGMVKNDYDREWKHWQRKFRKLEIEKTKTSIEKLKEELDKNPEYVAATQALDAATIEYKKNEVLIFNIQKELSKKAKQKYKVTREYQDQKSELDALRYELEEAKTKNTKNLKEILSHFHRKGKDVKDSKVKMEREEKLFSELDNKLNEFTENKKAAESNVNKVRSELDRLLLKEKKIARSFVNDILRDAPLLDFIDPSLRVKEIVVSELKEDYNFTKNPRIDSCMTCHVAIDKPGFEGNANPLKTHPRLELFLSNNSPHPIDHYGCTVCHLGMGSGLTFSNVGHTPQSENQASAWEKKYHWHRLVHWPDPMLPLKHVEATCYGCHQKDIDVSKADQLMKGISLVERSGCYGCHKIEGWGNIRKAGPSLRRISSKVSIDWILKWLKNPKAFRPTTTMPRFFDLSNTGDPESQSRNSAEIAGIVAYLETKASPYSPTASSTTDGNAEKGKELFGSVGCLGCHTVNDFPAVSPPPFGPDLSDVGSKLQALWLTAWLKNPKDYWPATRMPNLRLSDAQIRDLVAYLLTKRNTSFEEQPNPGYNPSTLAQVTLEYLQTKVPTEEAQNQLEQMSKEERLLFIGEKSIAKYGCFGCHEIGGFEEAKPIGTELTYEASKPLTRFDFGFVKIEKTVSSWIYQKLKDPRIFDKGRVREPQDKLRMPKFEFTDEEAQAVTTFVMGLRKDEVPTHRKPLPSARNEALRSGRALLHHYNCRGCHVIEGMGGTILAHYEDPSSGPPNLAGQGQKVQPNWFFKFLKAPSHVRPWLQVRMPTFEFSDGEANTLLRYFRALDHQSLDFETAPQVVANSEIFRRGHQYFQDFQCVNCHREGPIPPGTDTSNFAPSFSLLKNRLRYEWLDDWLRDPQKLLPGTRMPNLFYYEGQPLYPDAEEKILAIRDYLYAR